MGPGISDVGRCIKTNLATITSAPKVAAWKGEVGSHSGDADAAIFKK